MQVGITEKIQAQEQIASKIKSLFRNPLTFIVLVWGLMIFLAGLYFVYA